MAYNEQFIVFGTRSAFDADLAAGNVKQTSIVFIEDKKQIWAQGKFYSCPYTADELKTLLDNKANLQELIDHKANKDKKHIPEGGHERQILTWKADGEAKWDDLSNMFTGLEELLAYGVEWNTTSGDPHLTRIGNKSLHKTLPIQSQLKGCIAQKDKVIYWLDEEDWRFCKDPSYLAVSNPVYTYVTTEEGEETEEVATTTLTISPLEGLGINLYIRVNDIKAKITEIGEVDSETNTLTITVDAEIPEDVTKVELGSRLDGYDGTVRVYCPNFYIKSQIIGDIRRVWLSTVKIDNTWTYQPEILLDAYRCTVLRLVPENMGYLSTLPVNSAVSVVNTNAYCRGLGNQSNLDANLAEQPFNTALGKPAVSIPRANMRTYCRNAGNEMLSYEQYKNIFYWLWVVEYANFNSQEAYNKDLTEEGYHQGGMGAGVTTGNYEVNVTYGLIPCGYMNEFGNKTGVKTATFSNGKTVQVPRWRGFENPFGDIWTNLDGVLIDTPLAGASDASILPTCYIITDPNNYTDSLNGVAEKATRVVKQAHNAGYTKEWALGDAADMVPESVGGNTTQYKCDYYWVNYDDTPETLLVGGRAVNGTDAGLGNFHSYHGVSGSWIHVGFRSVSRFLSFSSEE